MQIDGAQDTQKQRSGIVMYKITKPQQITFEDFNQGFGVRLDKGNEWIRLADVIPWTKLESGYAALFKGTRGHVALPLRMALGALIIQNRLGLSDRMTVKAVTENPYLQYFLGLSKYQSEAPFTAPLMVAFRKRLNADFLSKCNDDIIENLLSVQKAAKEKAPKTPGRKKIDEDLVPDENGNLGKLVLDATCSPSNIKYPQDYVLLNKAREKLEEMIRWFCKEYGLPVPRTYKRVARQDYLALAKRRKRDKKLVRSTVRKMLGYVKRDLGYIEKFMSDGYAIEPKKTDLYLTILKLYEQQHYMWANDTHVVPDRIVSLHQPWIRPIVRGKAKSPTEFGVKFEVAADETGFARIVRTSFDPYNESSTLIKAIECFLKRFGHYPKRVLVDQIYRTRENISYCKERGMRLSGPRLGRKPKDANLNAETKKTERKDNIDRIEIERFFSLGKRCYGMGLIRAKLKETTLTAIAISVLTCNLFKAIPEGTFFVLYIVESEEASVRAFAVFEDGEEEDGESVV